nr:IS3 family transposase [Cupriavidus plantarum]
MGLTRACGLVGISRLLFHHESRRRINDEVLIERMTAIAAQKRRYGYRRIHVLLKREGCLASHKRIWRLYSKAGLSVRRRRRKRIAAVKRTRLPITTGPNQSWSMDFVSDGLAHGWRFRCLNVVDDYTRECLRYRGGHLIAGHESNAGSRAVEGGARLAGVHHGGQRSGVRW